MGPCCGPAARRPPPARSSRIALSAPAHDPPYRSVRATGEQEAQLDCMLSTRRSSYPRPCASAVRPTARLPVCYGSHRLPGQLSRQRGAARARRRADRTEGGLRMRAQGDDEPARRCRWPCGRRRRADRDRRQRPLRRAVPPPFLRAAAGERGAAAQPRASRGRSTSRILRVTISSASSTWPCRRSTAATWSKGLLPPDRRRVNFGKIGRFRCSCSMVLLLSLPA